MSITVIQSPATVVPAKNPVLFGLQTDNLYISAGTKAMLQLQVASGIVAGQSFKLSWNNIELTFTCAVIPDDSGLQFLYHAGAFQQAHNLADALQRNYQLSEVFDIEETYEAPYWQIILTAKEEGFDQTLIFSDNTCVGLTESDYAVGADVVKNELFKILVQVMVDNDTAMGQKVAEVAIEPQTDSKLYIDISEYLLANLTSNFTWPQLSDNALKMVENTKWCYIRFAEQYGNPLQTKLLTESNIFYAIPGGISPDKFKEYALDNSNWFTDISVKKLFLTNQPNTKYVRTDQPEVLYFLNYADEPILKLICNITYADNSTEEFVVKTKSGLSQYDTIEVLCNYTLLGLGVKSATAGQAIKQYDIWIENEAGDPQSEMYHFILETKPALFDRYLLFRNSLGTYDVFRTTGIGTNTVESTDIATKQYVNPASISKTTRQKKQSKKQNTIVLKLNTGYLSDNIMADYLVNELMLSDDMYLVIGGELYPVTLRTDKSGVWQDDNTLYFAEIELEMSFTQTAYSIPADLQQIIDLSGGTFNRSFSNSFDNA